MRFLVKFIPWWVGPAYPPPHCNPLTPLVIRYSMQTIHHTSVDVEDFEIIDQYTVADGMVSVRVTADGRYLVTEPPFSKAAGKAYTRIIEKMWESMLDVKDKTPAELERIVKERFWDVGMKIYAKRELDGLFHALKYYISRDVTGYGILHPLMTDPAIEDILISAPGRPAYIKHKVHSNRFHSLKTNVLFRTDADMATFISRMFRPTGNEPTVAKPGAVTYLRDKSRISATFQGVISEPGSTIAIRKFPEKPYVITHMMKGNTLTPRMCAYLWSLLNARAAGLIIGTTGSGKTTLLAALTTMMPPRWRILTIEDSLELQIPHEDWVRYHTKKTTSIVGSEHDVTIQKLIDQSLTQKPDYEIVGEIRDVADAKYLFQSMGTGHGGLCLPPNEMMPVKNGSTISYDTIRNIIERFRDGETLYAYSMEGGRCGWHRITGTIVKHGKDDWRRITAGGATCTVHAHHPMITDRGVIHATDVKIGDSIPAICGLYRDVAAYVSNGDETAIPLDADGGKLLAKQKIADLRQFALSGPEEFVRECNIIPERYHAIQNTYEWRTIQSVEIPSLGTTLYDIEVKSTGNFAHGDGIITHNTTFHANTPRGALTRMELGGVSHAELALLGFIVYVTEVRISGVTKRRVRNITEVTPGKDGKPVLKEIFSYSLQDDSFHEAKNILNTQQYTEACFRNNVQNPAADMKYREELLEECIARDANDVQSVFGILGRYYE